MVQPVTLHIVGKDHLFEALLAEERERPAEDIQRLGIIGRQEVMQRRRNAPRALLEREIVPARRKDSRQKRLAGEWGIDSDDGVRQRADRRFVVHETQFHLSPSPWFV